MSVDRTLKRPCGVMSARTGFCIEEARRPYVSNQNTAKIQKDRRGDVAQRRGAGQAEALARPVPDNLNPPARGSELGFPGDETDPLDDPADFTRPPLHGKVHPRAEMGDATPTLDDEARHYRHHPNDAGTTEFGFDPDAADAAADLAGDLGSQFLEGATRGEDLSSRVMDEEDRAETELPFLIDDELDQDDLDPERSGLETGLDEEESEFGEGGPKRAGAGAGGGTGRRTW